MEEEEKNLQVAAVIMMRRAQWFLISLPIVKGDCLDVSCCCSKDVGLEIRFESYVEKAAVITVGCESRQVARPVERKV